MTSVTVRLTRPTTGAKIMEAVQAIAEQSNRGFYYRHDWEDGDVYYIGQTSQHPEHCLLVIPTRDEEFVRPDSEYDRVIVTGRNKAVRDTDFRFSGNTAAIRVAREFGATLERHLSGENEAEPPSAWPQEIIVCALCELTPTSVNGRKSCDKHGFNPPTRTVRVTRVA
ncbi:hypothetical protein AB0L00_40160 [Actinoallomurus sp. NPDC052308]|uniref:hypothetical protein n=1 Tax=Actinoallomurus sp. NPDC052308 TaxID=3155530 RepID=UPI003431C0AA